jgi:predicted Zn-dependent peptidase
LHEKDGIKEEMEKVKNKFESSTVFSNTSILNKAANLSFFELIGNPGLINSEVEAYRNVTHEMVTAAISRYFKPSNCCTLNYISTRKV